MRGLNRLTFAAAALLLCAWSPGCGGSSASTTPSSIPPPAAQSWADEFDGPANALPDPAKWTYDLGNNNGWGNRELETYTNLVQNVHVDGSGHLIIHVDQSGATYTSARIKTQGLFSARYGRVEARIRLPFGQGIWPAFWMLGTNITSVGWPQCGEIDVMENIGREPSVNHGSLHGPGYSGGNSVTGLFTLPGGARFSDDFHVFAVQWAAQSVAFSVDGNTYRTVTPAALPSGAAWVFDNPFFLILNVAVGGNFPGNPDASTQFPQEMVVDYVRVSGAS
jgi:beta-glucanase (GH16 family)